ncbi:MAG: hypothetical protein LBV58_02810 [Acholeplasmatales bacterium]|jgi:vacuolar-type H+-ATPase subunit E/Vma4|nr:hypothetical protein [Acholeplasmatales bacterium]
MPYYNDDELYKYFSKAIKQYAIKEIRNIKNEINEIKTKETKNISDDILAKKELMLINSEKEIRISYQEELNHIGASLDFSLMKERDEMVSSIFNEVIQKLNSFRKTKKYEEYFFKKLKEIVSSNRLTDGTILIEEKDSNLIKSINDLYPKFKVLIGNETRYGGFILKSGSLLFDESFDERIRNEEANFVDNSKLFIKG